MISPFSGHTCQFLHVYGLCDVETKFNVSNSDDGSNFYDFLDYLAVHAVMNFKIMIKNSMIHDWAIPGHWEIFNYVGFLSPYFDYQQMDEQFKALIVLSHYLEVCLYSSVQCSFNSYACWVEL